MPFTIFHLSLSLTQPESSTISEGRGAYEETHAALSTSAEGNVVRVVTFGREFPPGAEPVMHSKAINDLFSV